MKTKKTPRQMVDDLIRSGPYDWVPPIPRYVDVADAANTDWASEYRRLLEHHTNETDTLYAVIRELVRQRPEKS